MICACMSVGKPGNGLVMRSAACGRAGPLAAHAVAVDA